MPSLCREQPQVCICSLSISAVARDHIHSLAASALVSPGTTDLVAPPDLLTTDQARLSALDAAIESAAWCSCSSKGLFSEFPPMPSSPTAMDSSTDLPSLESRAEPDSGMRRERKCAPSTTAAFHFQQSPRADSVRLEQIEFELLILPSGRVYNRFDPPFSELVMFSPAYIPRVCLFTGEWV